MEVKRCYQVRTEWKCLVKVVQFSDFSCKIKCMQKVSRKNKWKCVKGRTERKILEGSQTAPLFLVRFQAGSHVTPHIGRVLRSREWAHCCWVKNGPRCVFVQCVCVYVCFNSVSVSAKGCLPLKG